MRLIVDAVERLVLPRQLVRNSLDRLDRVGLGKNVGGLIGVKESDKLLGQIFIFRLGRYPNCLHRGHDVTVSALLHRRDRSESPCESFCSRSVGHFPGNPGAVWHKQNLIVQDRLLILGEVLLIGIRDRRIRGITQQLGRNVQRLFSFVGIPNVLLVIHHLVVESDAANIRQ
ncbi:hypothetical protein D3C81_1608460 [compost metagenome]